MNTDRPLRVLNLALAERVVKTCGNLRSKEVGDHFAEDAVLALPYAHGGTPREVEGRDAIIDCVGLLGEHFRQGIFVGHTLDTMADNPNELIARYSASTELLSNGRPYENSYVTLIEARDGKVVRYADYFDPINWTMAQGGSVEAPA